MANYAAWGSFSGHAANIWADAGYFNDDYDWSKYWFTSNENAVCWNNARCIRLLINKCDAMQSQIDAMGTVEEYKLTAKKICEAWAVNGFEDRALTVAFIDRMRQLIWNEPFYVRWAARPEE